MIEAMNSLYQRLRLKIGVMIARLIRRRHGVVIYYNDSRRRSMLDFVWSLPHERSACLSDHEALQLMIFVERTRKVPGDIAEIGCYWGGSATLIAREAAPDKEIHLFDTFEGLPPLENIDRSAFDDGMFVSDYETVKQFFAEDQRVHVYKGLFPEECAHYVKDKCFSFVNIDVDLYDGMKKSLEFVYPRMNKGGVVLIHDYGTAGGVRKAVDEFLKDKPEAAFDNNWRQCFFVKV